MGFDWTEYECENQMSIYDFINEKEMDPFESCMNPPEEEEEDEK